MAACVSESSYNTMFGVCIASVLFFVLVMAFYTHKFTKLADGTSDPDDNTTTKHISQGILITSIVIVLVVIFIYFSNTSRMKAAYLKI